MSSDVVVPDLRLADEDELTDRFTRGIAVAIAVVSLLAAVVGFLQNQAGTESGAAGRLAQAHAVEAADATVRSREEAFAAIDTWTLGLEQRVQVANLGPELAWAPADQQGTLAATRAAAVVLADRTAALSGIGASALDGPRTDPSAIWAGLAGLTRDRYRLEALQDAENELGAAWGRQITAYNAVLAIIAVSLYLLGLSLTIDVRRAKRLLAAAGASLAVIAVGWTGVQAASTPRAAPAEAADAYADGMVALAGAVGAPDFRAAVTAMGRAIELRPTFARAYATRGTAQLAADSPEQPFGAALLTLVSDATLAASSADYERALALGLDDTLVLWNLGALRFHQAIRGAAPLLDEGIRLTRQAVELIPDNPAPRYNLGLELLAAGRTDEARAAYEAAIAWTIYSDVAARAPRGNPAGETATVAGALTALEVLRAARPDLKPLADEIASRIVVAVGRGTTDAGPPPGSAAVEGLAVDVFPSFLQWRGNLSGFDASSVLSAVWWYRGPGGTAWSAVPGLSALSTRATTDSNPALAIHQFGQAQFAGTTRPTRCLPAGTYRIELSVDGRPIGTAEADAPTSFQPFSARDIGAVFCYPPGWTVAPESTLGYSAIAIGPGGDRGAGVVHLQQPASGLAPGDVTRISLDTTAAMLASRLGSTPVPIAGQEYAWNVMGLRGGTQRWESYDGGSIVLSGGIDADGGAYVTFAYGPKAWFDDQEWSWIVVSFLRVE